MTKRQFGGGRRAPRVDGIGLPQPLPLPIKMYLVFSGMVGGNQPNNKGSSTHHLHLAALAVLALGLSLHFATVEFGVEIGWSAVTISWMLEVAPR
jgi:hypothetical protein